MENAVMATEMLANLGIFLGAIGILWFVTVYRDKDKQNRKRASKPHLTLIEVNIWDCECLLTIFRFIAYSTQMRITIIG